MKIIPYSIAPEVFEKFPKFIRGVLLANGVKNCASPTELTQLLREAEDSLRARLTAEDLLNEPRVSAWRGAFRVLGIKPSEFRPSLEAMARRVLNGHELPSINALVDIGNIISLRHLISVGGHALDDITSAISLRAASGQEQFIAFGSEELEHPAEGEFIFAEGETVMTRRWVWRQSRHSLTELRTQVIEFNLDGLPPVEKNEILAIGEELGELVTQFCGGELRHYLLESEHPQAELVIV